MDTFVAGGRVITSEGGAGGTALAREKVTAGSILADVRIRARPKPLRQEDLGKRLGVLEDRVSRIENDHSPVSLRMFVDWCTQCGHDAVKVLKRITEEANGEIR